MDIYQFQKAVPTWGSVFKNAYNQFAAFYTVLEKEGCIRIALAARSYYRLYVNGIIKAHGPARTAEGYCRVDEIELEVQGRTEIAVEVAAYSKPVRYCNDCTMEPGLFSCEITDESGNVLSATGTDSWKMKELTFRRPDVETMSHSRPILEYYDLTSHSMDFLHGEGGGWQTPEILSTETFFLKRRSPYPTYRPLSMEQVRKIADIVPGEKKHEKDVLLIAKLLNPEWYASIPQENLLVGQICGEKEAPFTGTFRLHSDKSLTLTPGEHACCAVWEREYPDVGFIDFEVAVEKTSTIDVINSDHRSFYGQLKGNSFAVRYNLEPGSYHLTTFEPKLTRYIKMIFRTEGCIHVSQPELLEYTYPDERLTGFSCSDGELNRIYEASRRTLRLNTLDIFMDCPQRERGGWLCDSQFSAAAAREVFGDIRVEKDFLENFMLTNPDMTWKSFFPEVYPGVHKTAEDVGIQTWSFWLMTELYDYYKRSGDREFITDCEERVSRFVDGLLSLRGESGLLEGMTSQFVDWSLSNKSFALEPISIPNNCLAVNALEKLSELYHREDWKAAADEMRGIIEEMDRAQQIQLFGMDGDSAALSIVPLGSNAGQKKLSRTGCRTEAGISYEVWSGFHLDDDAFMRSFFYTQGAAPEYRSNPNIGKANVFIGLIVRFDILARFNRIAQLVREMKDLYLPELKDGSGTFFENYHAYSGCHGANGIAADLLTQKVLGIGMPDEVNKTVLFSPHPLEMRWAQGSVMTSDGPIFADWSFDPESRKFDFTIQVPKGWKYIVDEQIAEFGR